MRVLSVFAPTCGQCCEKLEHIFPCQVAHEIIRRLHVALRSKKLDTPVVRVYNLQLPCNTMQSAQASVAICKSHVGCSMALLLQFFHDTFPKQLSTSFN